MKRIFFAFLLTMLLGAALLPSAARADAPVVFAAASLKNALDEVIQSFSEATGTAITVSYAGSSALAWQISHGAPADIFISANVDWMDRLEEDGHIAPNSRIDLLGNELVLIGALSVPSQEVGADLDLVGLLGGGRLAMAFVDAVPAGMYGRAALRSLGLWEGVEQYVAQADNVRAALALVAVGEAPLGIVYASDATASNAVSVIGRFPAASHPSIVYPGARTAGRESEAADAFMDYLQSETAGEIFTRHGFAFLGQ